MRKDSSSGKSWKRKSGSVVKGYISSGGVTVAGMNMSTDGRGQ